MEYFRLMMPPWDTKGGCNRWLHMEVIFQHAYLQITSHCAGEAWACNDHLWGRQWHCQNTCWQWQCQNMCIGDVPGMHLTSCRVRQKWQSSAFLHSCALGQVTGVLPLSIDEGMQRVLYGRHAGVLLQMWQLYPVASGAWAIAVGIMCEELCDGAVCKGLAHTRGDRVGGSGLQIQGRA